MTQANNLSIDDLIKELDVGRATVKFILKRFSQWLPFDRINGDHLYSPLSIPVMFKIRDLLDGGVLPSQIEEILEKDPAEKDPAESSAATNNQTPPEKDIRMSKDALGFIQDLFQDIKGHQSRIARAHEKRAEAEERKAVAIEKRAEAEEKKADAMNNIATALQEMTRQRAIDNETMEIAGQAAHALTMNEVTPDIHADINGELAPADLEPGDLDIDDLDLEDMFDENTEVAPIDLDGMDTEVDPIDLDDIVLDDIILDDVDEDLSESETLAAEENFNLDDLSLLVEEQGLSTEELDDLSALIDTVSVTDPGDDYDNLEDLLEADISLPEPDDLSTLIDEVSDRPAAPSETDDLYSLVDEDPSGDKAEAAELDDLFSLVDVAEQYPDQPTADADMDNLSLLVDNEPEKETAGPNDPDDLDNLSLLIDSPAEDAESGPLDDLSLLVDSPDMDSSGSDETGENLTGKNLTGDDLWALVDGSVETQDPPMDDLSALVDTPPPEKDTKAAIPSLKPDITPDQDLAKYKAAVMKIILELKSQGLSAAETTERLNNDEVPTLSGKPRWAEKAIAKIFGFIDSAK